MYHSFTDFFKELGYRNYLNERRGVHLIPFRRCAHSRGALISARALIKKMQSRYYLTYHFPDWTKYKTQEKKLFVANSQRWKNIWLKKTLVLSFLQTIWMSASADIADFQMSALFLVWGGRSFEMGRSSDFSAVKKGAYAKEAFI